MATASAAGETTTHHTAPSPLRLLIDNTTAPRIFTPPKSGAAHPMSNTRPTTWRGEAWESGRRVGVCYKTLLASYLPTFFSPPISWEPHFLHCPQSFFRRLLFSVHVLPRVQSLLQLFVEHQLQLLKASSCTSLPI
jgi:hypothetical protein